MPWKMTEKPKTVLASKALIKEFVEMERVPRERPLSERRLVVYRRILKAGEFRPVTWASAVCPETNCTYRINGQHTSTMLSGLDPVPEFYVTVERYECPTLNGVAALYNTFDSRLAARTTSDINLSFASTIRVLEGVPARFIHYTVTAAAFHKWGEDYRLITPAERAEELMDAYPFALWVYERMPSGTRGGTSYYHLTRTPVVTAMMATWNRSVARAAEFWDLVKDEGHPDRDNPTRVLARYLIRATLGGGGARSSRQVAEGKRVVDFREMYVKCIHAWNAWRKGETTALNYHPKSPIPVVTK